MSTLCPNIDSTTHFGIADMFVIQLIRNQLRISGFAENYDISKIKDINDTSSNVYVNPTAVLQFNTDLIPFVLTGVAKALCDVSNNKNVKININDNNKKILSKDILKIQEAINIIQELIR